MKDQRCFYCERPAIALCDKVLSFKDVVVGKDATMDVVITCDRAICIEHRRQVGFICDRSRRKKNNNSDTIDICSVHVGGLFGGGPSPVGASTT